MEMYLCASILQPRYHSYDDFVLWKRHFHTVKSAENRRNTTVAENIRSLDTIALVSCKILLKCAIPESSQVEQTTFRYVSQ